MALGSGSTLSQSGTPPRVRGRLFWAGDNSQLQRYTPACAGKMPIDAALRAAADGTPPRVRGRYCGHEDTIEADRYTPACAGKMLASIWCSVRPLVHPRVCGEDAYPKKIAVKPDGTPPRVRGRSSQSPRGGPGPRYTPACAGKIRRAPERPGGRPVHPRVCGEDGAGIALDQPQGGTPPRVRGRYASLEQRLQRFRYTPACAGKILGSPPPRRG